MEPVEFRNCLSDVNKVEQDSEIAEVVVSPTVQPEVLDLKITESHATTSEDQVISANRDRCC